MFGNKEKLLFENLKIEVTENNSFSSKEFIIPFKMTNSNLKLIKVSILKQNYKKFFLFENSEISVKDLTFFFNYFEGNFILGRKINLTIQIFKIVNKKSLKVDNIFYLNNSKFIMKNCSLSHFKINNFIKILNSNLRIIHCFFNFISSNKNGSIICAIFNDLSYFKEAKIMTYKSTFLKNVANFNGGSIFLKGKFNKSVKIFVEVIKTYFLLNSANLGAVFYFENIDKIKLIFSKFVKNYAIENANTTNKANAGVFYFKNNKNKNYFFESFKVKYFYNKAKIGGIFYHFNDFTHFKENSSIKINNNANYFGQIIASEIKYIKFVNSFEVKYKRWRLINIISKTNDNNCLLKISGFDKYNQATYMIAENYQLEIKQITPDFNNFNNKFNFFNKDGFICIGHSKRNQFPIEQSFSYKIYSKKFGNSVNKIFKKIKKYY